MSRLSPPRCLRLTGPLPSFLPFAQQPPQDFKNRDYNLTTDVNLPTDAEDGVLATIGGRYSGWSFYLKDG